MEEEGEAQEGSQGRLLSLITKVTGSRTIKFPVQAPPVLSPSSVYNCKAFLEEEDADYEEEDEEDDSSDEEEEEDEYEEDEQVYFDGEQGVDMGSFSELGRKFLSKVWK